MELLIALLCFLFLSRDGMERYNGKTIMLNPSLNSSAQV